MLIYFAMKRKVIQIANSTQLVSLPRDWAKANNVQKGDEVEVNASEQGVLISLGAVVKPMKRADVRAEDPFTARLMVSALYKGGYDEIKLTFDDPELLLQTQSFVSENCIGFEVVDQAKNALVLRKISDTIHREFDSVFKRLLVFVKNMAQGTAAASQTHDKDGYKNVAYMDSSVNKFAYFCLRSLNKHPETRKEPVGPLYSVIDRLEGIGDGYKELCNLLTETKAITPALLRAIRQLDEYLSLTLMALQKLDLTKLPELLRKGAVMRDTVDKIIRAQPQSRVGETLNDITITIRNMASPIVLLSYHE